jgi:chromosomal replication initiator protein
MREWEQFLSFLEQELGSSVVKEWVRPLKIIRFDARNLYLKEDDPIKLAWFEEHVRPLLKKGFVNQNHRPIKVHLESPREKKNTPIDSPISFLESPIEPECDLSNFITAPGNLMAYKLIQDSPFNPLFIYGPKGSGKTHLLMGAALKFKKEKKRVFFVHTNAFTDHVVQAIRTGSMSEFRKIYRNIDILILDDIDKLGSRAATQEEFFHTFNTLQTLGKQIILSSRTAPSKLVDIESRLISRFEWGIAAHLETIDIKEIIDQKAKILQLPLTAQYTDFFATKFPKEPIKALQAFAMRLTTTNKLPPLDAAEKLLKDLLEKERQLAVTPEIITKAMSDHFGIKMEDLLGKSQTHEFAMPRKIAMYMCREGLQMSFQGIGKFFKRDHSTVMSSVKQIKKQIDANNSEILEALGSLKV